MVRLLRQSDAVSLRDVLCFNPTMVRLLPPAPKATVTEEQFQSHNGAIAAFGSSPSHGSSVSFNPTMVRLLLNCRLRSQSDLMKFQSHNGAIAAGFVANLVAGLSRFNPTMVRLLLAW